MYPYGSWFVGGIKFVCLSKLIYTNMMVIKEYDCKPKGFYLSRHMNMDSDRDKGKVKAKFPCFSYLTVSSTIFLGHVMWVVCASDLT